MALEHDENATRALVCRRVHPDETRLTRVRAGSIIPRRYEPARAMITTVSVPLATRAKLRVAARDRHDPRDGA